MKELKVQFNEKGYPVNKCPLCSGEDSVVLGGAFCTGACAYWRGITDDKSIRCGHPGVVHVPPFPGIEKELTADGVKKAMKGYAKLLKSWKKDEQDRVRRAYFKKSCRGSLLVIEITEK